jgi:hypothetical protein
MDDLRRDDRDRKPSTPAVATSRPVGRPSSTDARVHADIAALETMNLHDLRATWKKLHRTEAPPFFRRELLIRACAYKVQEKAYGGLWPKTRRRLLKIAAAAEQGVFTTTGAPRRLRPGTRLVREYGGVTHTVEVLADGFAWNDRKFRSLSAIAKAITGTNWNGHTFFGLTKSTKASMAAKSEEVDE